MEGEGDYALLMARVRQALACPVCYLVQRRYYLCVNSHSICEECYDSLENWWCPNGRCQYDDPPRRDLTAEMAVDRLGFLFECENWPCGFTGTLSEVDAHEAVCPLTFHGHDWSD